LNYFQKAATMKGITQPPINLPALADRLKVLAEPKRLLILHLLMEGVQCNCELGDALQMAPNLISHHLSVLRQAGLVDVERDAVDARWIYYSINQAALNELNEMFGVFFDPDRIKPRRPTCGPQSSVVRLNDIAVVV
jgi:ArsR family transcriptional regulator, arsenate/arsenite/antimonite-responsive transcriptional repressor